MRVTTGGGALSEEQKSAFLEGVKDAFQNFHVNQTVKAGTKAFLTKLTAAYIGTSGFYLGGDTQPTTEYIYPSAIVGFGSHQLPFSCARVVTLRTNIERGRGAYGRFYWPCQEIVDAEGHWAVSDVTTVATQAKTLIDSVNNAARVVYTPASSVSVFSSMGTGEVGKVIRVGVGRAPDTQRRRDNKVKEEHVYANLGTVAADLEERQSRIYSS
jgi:hypothetical protein